MSELIKVTIKDDQQLVSARDLYTGLEIKTRFSQWVKQNFKMFREGTDFSPVVTTTQQNQWGGTKEIQDYALTVDMAKQVSLMSQTPQGSVYREYFIKLEKQWNDPRAVVKRGYSILLDENKQLKAENKQLQVPALLGNAVAGSDNSISIGNFAKVLSQKGIKIGRNRLFAWLKKNRYLISNGRETNSPTQRSRELDIMEVRETVITTNHGSKTRFTPLITGKGQQYFIEKFLKEQAIKA